MVKPPSGWWSLGWALGAAVAAVAAGLLLTIIALARRIVHRARDIESALDAARDNTQDVFGLTDINEALDRSARELRASEARG